MPSLSTKNEPVTAADPAEFSKNMVVMMEKKIRNLEKRKGKLEDYRGKQASGHTLNEEQLKAVAKLDDVLSQIDLLQDLTKQVTSYGAEVMKQQKRQQKRERFEQIETERKRFLEVLQLQSVLNALGADETRQAFVEGAGGLVKLEEQELTHLDELYKILNPERSGDKTLNDQLKTSSEHLQSVLDARDKPVCGTTYRQLNDLITKIKSSSYFTKVVKAPEVDDVEDTGDTSTEKEFVVVKSEEVPHADSAEVQSSLPPEVVDDEPKPKEAEQMYQQPNMLPVQSTVDPTKTFEKIVENVQGRFNFIQDSEIDVDSPSHVDPAVVSVHPMPTQQYQQTAAQMINHNQSQAENSTFNQQASDVAYQQYNMQSAAPHTTAQNFVHADAVEPIPVHNEPAAQPSSQTRFAAPPINTDTELNFDIGITFESSLKQHDKPAHNDEYAQRNQGGMRRGGGYRGGRGNHNNGFGGRGGYRGGSDRPGGYRGGERPGAPGGDRPRHEAPSGNGFQTEYRRGGRGGGGARGGNSGYRGGSNRGPRGGGSRGGFRGQHQQQSTGAQQQQQQQ